MNLKELCEEVITMREFQIPYPGDDPVANNRKKWMNSEFTPRKLREISDDDIVSLLGHRKPGTAYSSVHPPLDEMKEAADPIKELVVPTDGAKAGDRIRYIQFADSMHFAPLPPWMRFRMYGARLRGFDSLAYSGRTLLEMRERDLDETAKFLVETEIFDASRVAMRSVTVHGFSLRLDEDGLMFDARRRYVFNKETGEVEYVKTQRATPLDRRISVGKPLPEDELKTLTTRYHTALTSPRDADELIKVVKRVGELRVLGGLRPDLVDGR
ncbi:MAG: methyl coenzyme M reductase subunit gamma [Candidatus Syntrophoarchaeum caldarius]|uniref:coenzyme-B sulfoethylthiotransferase n=1 Tax=Candidatus Syntropharchaeum caldarium TaxID=1838285 RepID=A0A1F2P9Z1_9EURY|nr:MAG: methyl coenzyme M reductase subunit gamma [Candidatus Syntrophoarchaeum caldarius]